VCTLPPYLLDCTVKDTSSTRLLPCEGALTGGLIIAYALLWPEL
jgi:hypothetical protein